MTSRFLPKQLHYSLLNIFSILCGSKKHLKLSHGWYLTWMSSISLEIPSKTSSRLGIYISFLSGGCRKKHVVILYITNCWVQDHLVLVLMGILVWLISFSDGKHGVLVLAYTIFANHVLVIMIVFFYYFQMIMKGSPTNAEIWNPSANWLAVTMILPGWFSYPTASIVFGDMAIVSLFSSIVFFSQSQILSGKVQTYSLF